MAKSTLKTTRVTRATKSANTGTKEPPVTPGEAVQTGANIVAAQPTTEAEERDINGLDKDGRKVKPMPKDFGNDVVIEGHRVVLRQDGIEVPFRNTDDKDAYKAAHDEARGTLWEALQTKG